MGHSGSTRLVERLSSLWRAMQQRLKPTYSQLPSSQDQRGGRIGWPWSKRWKMEHHHQRPGRKRWSIALHRHQILQNGLCTHPQQVIHVWPLWMTTKVYTIATQKFVIAYAGDFYMWGVHKYALCVPTHYMVHTCMHIQWVRDIVPEVIQTGAGDLAILFGDALTKTDITVSNIKVEISSCSLLKTLHTLVLCRSTLKQRDQHQRKAPKDHPARVPLHWGDDPQSREKAHVKKYMCKKRAERNHYKELNPPRRMMK